MNLTALIPPGPFAIEPVFARQFLAQITAMNYAAHLSAWQAQARPKLQGLAPDGSSDTLPYTVSPGGVATIELKGPMSKDGAPSLGMPGTSMIRRQVRQAQSDPGVQKVRMLIDSPGGTIAGAFDLAADVKRLSDAKPTYAYVEDTCCSAAYLIASQCNAIMCNASAMVGSIGVALSLVDSSGAAEQQGLRFVYLTTGGMKSAGGDGVPLTEEQEAYLQGMVDTWGGQFFAAVQKGRGFSDEQLAAVKDARIYIGAQARAVGLVDRVTSSDNALAALRAIKPA